MYLETAAVPSCPNTVAQCIAIVTIGALIVHFGHLVLVERLYPSHWLRLTSLRCPYRQHTTVDKDIGEGSSCANISTLFAEDVSRCVS